MNMFPKRPPIFVALGEASARLDPAITPTAYSKLTLTQPPETNGDGYITHPGQVMTLWLDKENLKQLADVLHAEGVYELMENKS